MCDYTACADCGERVHEDDAASVLVPRLTDEGKDYILLCGECFDRWADEDRARKCLKCYAWHSCEDKCPECGTPNAPDGVAVMEDVCEDHYQTGHLGGVVDNCAVCQSQRENGR